MPLGVERIGKRWQGSRFDVAPAGMVIGRARSSHQDLTWRTHMNSAFHVLTSASVGAFATLAVAQQAPQPAPDNAIPNPDGSRTILRSQQLPEANARHARWCAEHGGVDVTNEGDLTLSADTYDAVICVRTDFSKPGFSGAYIPEHGSIITPDNRLETAPAIGPDVPSASTLEELENQQSLPRGVIPPTSEWWRSLKIPTISVYPNNGYTVKTKTLFHAASYARFTNFSGGHSGRVESSIPALNCHWRWQGRIRPGHHQVDGFTGCYAPRPGVVRTKITACSGVMCARGEGTFVAIPQ